MIGELIMYHTLAVPVFFLTAGIALAFFGSRIIPFVLVLCALILGFLHGGSVLLLFTDKVEILRYGPVVLAVLFAVAVSFLYRVAFFLAGLFIGYFASSALFPELSVIIVGIITLVSGALVYVSRNFVFSVLTSVMGAGLAATGSVNLIAWMNVSAGITAYWAIVVFVFICGIVYQTKRNKGRK
ncbi:MAG: hypothetical protein KAR40_14780 [Candidatus Sabulitectum sp.]|nr:hypothetical protein [Candidatus Sabulitectum sp.]